jgi:magnesium chelatase subunit D
VAAARTALPADLLAGTRLPGARAAGARAAAAGRKGAARRGDDRRGRLTGVRADLPRGGRRLALIDTLRAAVPWQRVRGHTPGAPLALRAGDLRVERRRQPTGTTTVVVVDASGSAALGRLGEAKGAVELLLAESYARRDRVALVAFRGTTADVLLPPTRALARARRAVTALPAGGGTPLAAALVAAAGLSGDARREGARPAVVLLTDGRANVALDGTTGRGRALAEAHAAARSLATTLAGAGGLAVVVDTGARAARGGHAGAGAAAGAGQEARDLARALGARYVALPHLDARGLHARVRAALDDHGTGGGAA